MTWLVFFIIISVLLVFDLGFVHHKNGVMSFRQSALLSVFYFVIACLFGVYVLYIMGGKGVQEYFTCFLVEKAMSLDNLFIISVVFQFFQVPVIYRHRVLFFGIIGVIIFRAIMIYGGIIIVTKFSWILYIFAVILVITGIKAYYFSKQSLDIQNSYIYKILQRYLNITSEIVDERFIVRIKNKIYVTPLFVSLILIEMVDIIFAVDSVPAIFAITNDAYIIYTSNIFAILGLRSLFFCLDGVVDRFYCIKYSLALILILIGFKIFIQHFIDIPTYIPLIMTVGLLLMGVVVSIYKQKM